MINYELAKKLKEAGFPQRKDAPEESYILGAEWTNEYGVKGNYVYYIPTLSELIEACGEKSKDFPWGEDIGEFEFCLQFSGNEWNSGFKDPNYNESWSNISFGSTPEEAVAKLWLALNEK